VSADSASTDLLHRFSFENAPIRGQWVRLEGVLSQILAQQPYPAPVRRLLGQMLGAVSMFADGIKFEGSVTLHSQGNGPLTTLMAECRSQNLLRAIARWDRDVTLRESVPMSELLGGGQLAISLLPSEPGGANIPVSYQGLINLEQGDFAHNLEAYFATSEQLPSRLFFASGDASVTGLLIQRMPVADDATEIELDEHEALWSEVESSIQQLADTVRPAELSSLAPAVLLARLFNEHALNLHPPRDLRFECTCNRDKTAATLKTLTRSELLELLESQGQITVTCEVCGCKYRYDSVDTHMLLERGNPRIH
jgi:molecular chaperone Hsp33